MDSLRVSHPFPPAPSRSWKGLVARFDREEKKKTDKNGKAPMPFLQHTELLGEKVRCCRPTFAPLRVVHVGATVVSTDTYFVPTLFVKCKPGGPT